MTRGFIACNNNYIMYSCELRWVGRYGGAREDMFLENIYD